MKLKTLIVEDSYDSAHYLEVIMKRAGHTVMSVMSSVTEALSFIKVKSPDLVLLGLHLKGPLTGIDFGKMLADKGVPFIYIIAESNKELLKSAKVSRPYGFIIEPFREEDVLIMLDVAWYIYEHNLKFSSSVHTRRVEVSTPIQQSEVISKSKLMKEVLDKVGIVCQTDTSVLICGESGTGKELIAKTIHKMSRRKDNPLIVVNCAALPAHLIESELFGHEKGSFTGANLQRVGKFEQANGGTIFLDEIGELSLDLQVKFLRVLQEMEIDPIGGSTKKIDVRVIAATNRNLEQETENDNFRLDLFYRLNIFPIYIPALRERKDDIIPMANFFLSKHAEKERKEIKGLSDHVKNVLWNYSWPGNVRELENIMARSVLLVNDNIVDSVLLPKERQRPASPFEEKRIKTLEENERDHIVMVLNMCKWKVYGDGGAARILDVNVSTLNSKMRKLGIIKPGRR